MDLSDALGQGWPGQPNNSTSPAAANPSWPGGQPAGNPSWPGGQPAGNPSWPGGQPAGNPSWPGGQPAGNPSWPGGQPAGNPSWPGGQPAGNPSWPGGQPAGNPTNPSWPGGQPAGNPTNPSWPGGQPAGNPTNPSWPGGHPAGSGSGQPSQPNAPQSGGWPSPAPGTNPVPSTPQILKVPYSQTLPQGVFDKLLITIAGTVKSNAQKIAIDMNAGQDLAFHFNPRFNDNGKKVIVRNCRINNKWGKEERDAPCFPFSQGQPFEMKILCTNSEFKVAVNNSHLLSFTHKIRDLSTIKSFNIHKDVTLSKVHVEKLP